jgi:hypothetical protein
VGPCEAAPQSEDDIPTLLDKIPDEFKPLAALGIGAFVLVFIALFHGAGLHWIQVQQTRGQRRLSLRPPRLIAALFLFGWSVFLMLDLHIVEVLIWATAINRVGFIKLASDAFYFCANCYTTLGLGKADVVEHWKLISPIIGISGLFTFAWTTSALVDVVASNRQLIDRMEDERDKEIHMRLALQKEEWAALRGERDAERAEKEKAEITAVGSSLIQKLKIWRRVRKRVSELRRGKIAEMEDLLRQERLKERESAAHAAGSSNDQKLQK